MTIKLLKIGNALLNVAAIEEVRVFERKDGTADMQIGIRTPIEPMLVMYGGTNYRVHYHTAEFPSLKAANSFVAELQGILEARGVDVIDPSTLTTESGAA